MNTPVKAALGLQLYSVRDDCRDRGLPAVLREVAAMGYEGVEFAGFYDTPAGELRKMLDDIGLRCCGSHTPLAKLLEPDFEATADYNETLGNRFLIVPGLLEEYRASADAWRKTAELFNELAAKLASRGMVTGYHNHTIEFTPMDGVVPWDLFFDHTRPEVVMQIDTGNAIAGGADPLPYLIRYPGRAVTLHLKEHSADKTALIGEGDTDWKEVLRLSREHGGTEWNIVEQETHKHPPMECARICLENLRALGY